MKEDTTILWLRKDLRLDDHPALAEAAGRGAVLPVYIDDPALPEGAASRWWLHGALADLGDGFAALGSRLILRRGSAPHILSALAQQVGAFHVFASHRYEADAIRQEQQVDQALAAHGCRLRLFQGSTLFDPQGVRSGGGTPYRVFTPYYKATRELPMQDPIPKPRKLVAPSRVVEGEDLGAWALLPTAPDWAGGFRAAWNPTRKGAADALKLFLEDRMQKYESQRDFPALQGTSCLSPFLQWGQMGPRRIVQAVRAAQIKTPQSAAGGEAFLRQLVWREFALHVLAANPSLADQPLQRGFAAFPWRDNAVDLDLWQRGQTGYPIVDAGMRQLWLTGWMHNRVRMIVGSFLVKDLRLPWQQGERWFRDTLVDADLANNAFGWQWIAGCGADAAPYFRIFNPVLQAKKFDPTGDYIRTFVPELRKLAAPYLYAPWTAPAELLRASGASLYPRPMVDHDTARKAALAAYQGLEQGT